MRKEVSRVDGYVYAVRAWSTNGFHELTAITARGGQNHGFWTPGTNTATCWKPWHTTKAPKKRCRCGFYAYAHSGYIENEGHNVHGIVRMWGKVMRHEVGFRAQFAMPVYLQVQGTNLARELARHYYDIPVEQFPNYDRLGDGYDFRRPLQRKLQQAAEEQW